MRFFGDLSEVIGLSQFWHVDGLGGSEIHSAILSHRWPVRALDQILELGGGNFSLYPSKIPEASGALRVN